MKHSFKILTAVFVILSFLAGATGIAYALTSGQAANRVLGQPNFISSTTHTTRNGMWYPSSVAIDPTTGKVFVADSQNNRVLRFASVTTLASGANAEIVLGQANFTSKIQATASNRMNNPQGVFVDSAGRLWVADSYNNRVLRFDSASSRLSGASANVVLGQPNFTSHASLTSQKGMSLPISVFVDSAGRLWVADTNNSRVLRFDNAASKTNYAAANGELGQPGFTSSAQVTTRNGMNYPEGVTVDAAGHLWVADYFNHRVLRLNNAAAKANGANADAVLGQVNFISKVSATTQKNFSYPQGVFIDGAGRLWVADYGNNRVLGFANAATLGNYANASLVIGQATFSISVSATTAKGLSGPTGVFYSQSTNWLWVVDNQNSRVLRY